MKAREGIALRPLKAPDFMASRLATRALAVLFLLVGFCLARPLATLADADVIVLESGASTVVDTPGLTRVSTGDPAIAGVVPIGMSQVVIVGKSTGRTTVFVWSYGEVRKFSIVVTGQVTNDVAGLIRSEINNPAVKVRSYNNLVVISGTVYDIGEANRIKAVAGAFEEYSKQIHESIVDAVSVEHPLGQVSEELAHIPGATNVHLDYDPKGTGDIIVSGVVKDRQEAEQILARARGLAGRYLASDAKVIDRLAVDLTTQVDVKVYVLEVDQTGLSELGVNFQSAVPTPNGGGTFSLQNPSFPIVENFATAAVPGHAFNVGAFFRSAFLAPTLDLVLQSGHGRILSAPDLVTLPGNEAKFLVGGTIPYTYASGLGTVSVQFQQYGVQLDVTPTILGNGKIECKIAPTISDLDFANEVTFNNTTIPALKISQLSTDVITSEGQGIIMGGMLRHLQEKTVFKVPGLSAIPILGQLFQSVHYQNSQTDIVFVMTPVVINQ
jgi:Flp pilus assembly secretin CpaC